MYLLLAEPYIAGEEFRPHPTVANRRLARHLVEVEAPFSLVRPRRRNVAMRRSSCGRLISEYLRALHGLS